MTDFASLNKMNQPETETPKRLYCNRCDGDTNHAVVWSGMRSDALYFKGDDDGDLPTLEEVHEHRLWRCLGCDSVSLEHRYGLDFDDKWHYEYHPKPTRHAVKPKCFTKLPERLATIYKEAVTCFNSSSRILCAVGLRGLVQGICRDKGISGQNIEKEIEGLKKLLPDAIVENLHSLRFMGNQATHELDPPSGYDLAVALEICEDLLNYLYELDYKTARLAHWKKRKSNAGGGDERAIEV